MNLENSMVVGAQRQLEAMELTPEQERAREVALLDVIIQLEVALMDVAPLPPVIKHAREHILDCALDDYEVLQAALMESLGDGDEAGSIIKRHMSRHVREYAEGHLSTLAGYFDLDEREPEPDEDDALSALLKEQAA